MTGQATARAWGWVAHLRDGGTTPWRAWSGTAEPAGPVLPGAQQLELARRVNLAGAPTRDLLERVLAADPPRRSRPALPLHDGPEVPGHGPRPVDPARVRAVELLDLVAVVLAHELATLGPTTPPEPPAGVRRPWAVRYRLDGDPELSRALRRHLTARGRPPSRRPGRLIVVGTDVGSMLVDLWVHRSLGDGAVPWDLWWRRKTGRDQLPGRLDLERIVARGLAAPGVRDLHLVTDPALAAGPAGLGRPLPPHRPLAATAVDLGRRVVAALRPALPPAVRRPLVSEVLRPRLAGIDGPPPVVPAAHRAWTDAQAARLVARLARDGDRYPVSGSLELLLPGDRPGVEVIRPRDTLATGIGLLLAGDGPTPQEPPEEAS